MSGKTCQTHGGEALSFPNVSWHHSPFSDTPPMIYLRSIVLFFGTANPSIEQMEKTTSNLSHGFSRGKSNGKRSKVRFQSSAIDFVRSAPLTQLIITSNPSQVYSSKSSPTDKKRDSINPQVKQIQKKLNTDLLYRKV